MALVRGTWFALARQALVRGLLLAAVWWILTEDEPASWSAGVIVVGLATAAAWPTALWPVGLGMAAAGGFGFSGAG